MRPAPRLVLLSLLLPLAASAQTMDANRWVPNGQVYAVQQFGSTTYIGGDFTMLSPPTGGAATIQTANELLGSFPKVDGRVYAVIPDGSGGWFLGGIFSNVGGQPRNNVARVNSDYSVSSWNPNANGPVYALQLSFVGSVYAGGDFTSIGGQARSRLAELDLTTGNANTLMTIGVNGTVRAFTWNANAVYAVGDFTTAGGLTFNRGCSININTRGLGGWNPNVSGPVYAIRTITRPGPITTILIGGSFSTVGGQARSNLAETNASVGSVAAWNPSPNGTVRAIETRLGLAYVGGDFTAVAGATRNHAAAIDVNGLATSWNPNVDGSVCSILNNATNVFVGGTFQNVGGAPFTNLARIDATTGVPVAWNPKPNGVVRTIVDNTSTVYVGGDFTGVGGVERRYLAAYDDATGSVASWNPQADGVVRALALRTFGPVLYTVYAGGGFQQIGGQPRSGVAAIHPATGVPSSFSLSGPNSVSAIAVTESLVVLGGVFIPGSGTVMGTVPHAGGAITPFSPVPAGGSPLAFAVKGDTVYVGHSLGIARYSLASHTRISEANPYLDSVPVWALCVKGDFIYIGGEFTHVNTVQNRPYLIRIRGNGQADAWNPSVDGIVRAVVPGETGMVIGGDFRNAGGQPRVGVAQLDETTGLAQAWTANLYDFEVDALASRGPRVGIGGRFRGIGSSALANFASAGPPRIDACSGGYPGTPAGSRPQALAMLDIDGAAEHGLPDAVVCDVAGPSVQVLLNHHSANFNPYQDIPVGGTPRAVVSADFDLDGHEDFAVSESDDTGSIVIYRNASGTYQPILSVPLPGRCEGFTVGDYDADGILDMAVCLVDSAQVPRRGGLQFLKGGGTNGVWNGAFALSTKVTGAGSVARRVVAQDFDQDGWMEFVFSGSESGRASDVRLGPGMQVACALLDAPVDPPGEGDVALAVGDFNDDGRSDLVTSFHRSLRVRMNNGIAGCGNRFMNTFNLDLPSTPRDLVAMDVDTDGIIDIVCAFDSLAELAYCKGNGTNGVGSGTFAAPVQLDDHDVYAIVPGFFYGDGIGILHSRPNCGLVGLFAQSGGYGPERTLRVDAPNGGESWTGTPASQTISWTKLLDIGGVDVDLSRDNGVSWRRIGSNVPGTSLNWLVSPAATSTARVRVRDAYYTAYADTSDAPFSILNTAVDVPGQTLHSGLRLVGRNPARGPMKFLLEVASPSEVGVLLYDAAGRRVRVLAQGTYAAGRHDLAWDGCDRAGAACRSGVYFVKARIGSFEATRKIVLL